MAANTSATKLSVNVNAIAMLRNRRDLPWPDVVDLSRIALQAGAHGITVHPRPDARHIRRQDVFDLVAMIRGEFPAAEFNIEGYPSPDFLELIAATKPDQATLVPDEPGQSTSDHGWDVARHKDLLRDVIRRLRGEGARVSLFTDADPAVAEHARAVGANRIELYTGPYGHTFEAGPKIRHLDAIVAAAESAKAKGLGVNAGHDLTRDNLPPLIARVPFLAEVSIGHALVGDALIFGMAETVRRYIAACGG